ncbi:Ig-like domain-containing protein [Bacillus velezensis]|uniref:Ig-like domain-containing protein n=1 Tax=Bacillus velezensis TaxID=492670 RepID=UPI0037464C84
MHPNAPQGLTASVTDTEVSLNWDAVTFEGGIKEYEVYRDGVSLGTRVKTSFSESGLKQETTYRYQVKAISTAGKASPLSDELIVTTKSTDPTSVTVEPTTKTLAVGETFQIKASVLPAEAKQDVTYTSGTQTVASVSSGGLVTAKTAGNTTITVSSKHKTSVKKSLTVTVTQPTVPDGE